MWFGERDFFQKGCHSTTHSERDAQQSEGRGHGGDGGRGGSTSPAEIDRAGEKENENEGTATGTCSLTPRLHQTAVLVRDCPLHTTTTDHVLFACFVAVVAPASRQARGRVAEQRATATKKGTRAEHKLRL